MNERRIIAMVSQKVARLRRIGEIGHSMENHPNTVARRERYRIEHDIQPFSAAEARRRGVVVHCEECWSHHDPSRCPEAEEES